MQPAIPAARGTVLVLAPHMDDEVLGCGGLLAGLPDRSRVHVLYATNGLGAATMDMPGIQPDPGLDFGAVRRREALAALAQLGVPPEQARFVDVPDFEVSRQAERVRDALVRAFDELRPACALLPFRYDRHPDHVALNRLARALLAAGPAPPDVLEDVVYHRWRLLPGGDVRRCMRPGARVEVDIAPVAAAKRAALESYRSQTTLFFPWQLKPVLSARLIEEECRGPELFLRAPPAAPDRELLAGSLTLIRLVHRVEPFLKRHLERMRFRLLRRRGRPA